VTTEVDSVYNGHATPEENEKQQYLWLSESGEYLLDKGDQLHVGQYCRLKAADFSMIDSLFFILPSGEPSPILIAFRIRRNMVHDSIEEDLHRVDRLNLSPHTIRKFFVVVTPDSIQPEIKALGTFLGGAGDRMEWGE